MSAPSERIVNLNIFIRLHSCGATRASMCRRGRRRGATVNRHGWPRMATEKIRPRITRITTERSGPRKNQATDHTDYHGVKIVCSVFIRVIRGDPFGVRPWPSVVLRGQLIWLAAALAWLCAVTACGSGRRGAPASRDVESANAAVVQWRAKHEADYRREWASIAGLSALKPGLNSAGSAPANDIVLPASTP